MFHFSNFTHENNTLQRLETFLLRICLFHLDNFDSVEEGHWESDQHQQQGADGQEVRDNAGTLITNN